MPLIYISCAWVIGIFLGSKLNLPFVLIFIGLMPLPFLFLRRHRKLLVLTSLCLIAFFSGAVCFQSSLPEINQNSLQFYNDGKSVEIKGMVDADPELTDKSAHLRLAATEIKSESGWQQISGTALLFAPRYSGYEYGDVLLVKGKLETPGQLDDFDYGDYLAHEGIYSTMLYPQITLLEKGRGAKPLEWIYSLRNSLSRTLATVLPEPQSSLAQGMILGIRGNIPSYLNADLSRTGTAHILAISGLNISIVAGILVSFGIWLFGRRRYIYVWLALAAIWFYALISGMDPPVVRGTIMASLFLFAELLGRQRSALTALAFAAAIMIGINPQVLWSASFQLSFLSMAGLILLAPAFQNIGRKAVSAVFRERETAIPIANVVADSFSITLGALIAIMPVIAYYFGIVSFVSPVATFFALPVLPGIIISGALAGVVGLIALPVAQVVGWLTWLFTSYMLMVIGAFASIPSAAEVVRGNATAVLIYYLVLALIVWLVHNWQKLSNSMSGVIARLKSGGEKSSGVILRVPGKWIVVPLLVLAVLVWTAAFTMPDDNLHVSFFDVGEGDAILIQTPNHQDILIDGGPSAQALSLGLGKKLPFWDRTIDLLILTHPHMDHLTGQVEVLRRYEVKQVLSSDLNHSSPLYDEWLSLIREKGIKYSVAQAGQEIALGGGASIKVLNPQKTPLTDTESDIDNNSLVLRLSMGKANFLLTADTGREAEWELIANRADLHSTVLKVAHHGSETSTTSEFLAVVKPQLAVISVGADNRFGHPSTETMSRLEERLASENIYRTDVHGTIEFTTDGERLWVKTEK